MRVIKHDKEYLETEILCPTCGAILAYDSRDVAEGVISKAVTRTCFVMEHSNYIVCPLCFQKIPIGQSHEGVSLDNIPRFDDQGLDYRYYYTVF